MRKLKKELWPHSTAINESKSKEAEAWCKENLGQRFRNWYSYTVNKERVYAFKDTDTLLVFKLKWGYQK